MYYYPDLIYSMGNMMLSSSAWRQSTVDLLNILGCRYDEITLLMLGAAFFERGWVEPRGWCFHGADTIALGDIGYKDEASSFVFVDNVHDQMRAEFGTLSWNWRLRFWSGDDLIEDTPAEVIFSQTANAYQRRRQVHFPICLCL